MKRAPLTLFIALVLFAGIGAVWWLSDTRVRNPGALTADLPEALTLEPGPALSGDELVALDVSADDASVEAASSPPAEKAPRRSTSFWAPPKTARWIEGRIESKQGLPLDEKMVVVAEGRAFPTDPSGSDTYRAEVDGAGRFRIAFSPDTLSGRIWVEGRYAYLKKPEVLKLRKHKKGDILTLNVELGGRIIVEVLPPRSAAFAEGAMGGIEVEARVDGWSSVPGLDGRPAGRAIFELGGAWPEQAYVVSARSPVHANGELEDVSVEPGQTQHVSVELRRGALLAGTVHDRSGEPILYGEILALTTDEAQRRNPFMNREVHNKVEIVNGEFELRGVPPGESVLVVEADGYLEYKQDLGQLVDGGERSSLAVILSRGGIVSGVVRWPDGEPATGAEVRISQADSMGSFDFKRVHDKMTTGSDGTFSFSALKEGICAVTAVCVERGWELPEDATLSERKFGKRPPAWRVHDDKVTPGRSNLALVLQPGSNLRGTVVDDAGEPVESFRVTATPADAGFLSTSGVRAVKSRFKDSKGRFELLGLMAGSWRVRASATGYGQGDQRTIRAPYGGEIRLSMPRAGVIEGLVRTPDGGSSKGASVDLVHGNDRKTSVDVNREGMFKASKVEPGRVTMTASLEGYARSLPFELVVGSAEQREDLVLELRAGASILGELHESITDREGRTVKLGQAGSRSQETQDDGSFAFEGLDPGTYDVILTPNVEDLDGQARWIFRQANERKIQITLVPGQVETVVLGEPSAESVQVTGTVTDDGESIPKAIVMVYSSDGPGNDALAGAQADLDGVYAVTLDEPGDYRFEVGREFGKLSSVELSVPGVREFRHDVELPQGMLRGTVVEAGGTPLANVVLTLSRGSSGAAAPWMSSQRAQSDASGAFIFEDLAPGSYDLRAAIFGGRTDLGHVLLREVKVSEDGSAGLQVELPVAGEVQGMVQDAQGDPINRATIWVETEDGTRVSEFRRVRSSSDGSFTQGSLAPGDTWLRATKEGRSSEAVKVQVTSAGVAQVTLTVPND